MNLPQLQRDVDDLKRKVEALHKPNPNPDTLTSVTTRGTRQSPLDNKNDDSGSDARWS